MSDQKKVNDKNLNAHRSWKFDDSDFLWHLLAFEAGIPGPLHHSSFSPRFRSLSRSLSLARAHTGNYRYVLLRALIGLDQSARSVLHSTVPSLLLLQLLLLLILLGWFPLLVWTRPRGLLLLGATFYYLQTSLDIGTWCKDLRIAVGRDGGGLIGIL